MFRRMMAVIAPLALLSLSACGGDSNGSDVSGSTTSGATVSHTVSPDPAPATPSSDPNYQWHTSFTVTLTETAGVAATVRSLAADLQQAAGGIVITPPTGLDESFRFQVTASGNRLDAKGTIVVDFDFLYTLPNGGREALVTVSFNIVDDQGVQQTKTVQVKVA